jgi:hypothetical protein
MGNELPSSTGGGGRLLSFKLCQSHKTILDVRKEKQTTEAFLSFKNQREPE